MGIAVRLFQFMNSFYRDGSVGNFDVRGDYCCLGYFDALNVRLIEFREPEIVGRMREMVYEEIISTIDGKCSQKNIICVTENREKDALFWEKQCIMPYLFITMVHIQQEENKDDEGKSNGIAYKVEELIEEINKGENSIAYYTYDHCELVIAHFGKSYNEGLMGIFEYLEKEGIYKLYSTFCVWQDMLDKKEELVQVIEKENIDCLLRASLKDFSGLNMFLDGLMEKFPDDGVRHIMKYRVLGSKDIVIKLEDIPMEELLECYKSKCLLNHNNELYKKTFFNIETEIIEARKRGNQYGNMSE